MIVWFLHLHIISISIYLYQLNVYFETWNVRINNIIYHCEISISQMAIVFPLYIYFFLSSITDKLLPDRCLLRNRDYLPFTDIRVHTVSFFVFSFLCCVFLFWLSALFCVLCSMLPVSLNCPFLIAPLYSITFICTFQIAIHIQMYYLSTLKV